MTPKRFLRSVAGIAVGIVFLSAVVEGVEFGLVRFVLGEPAADPQAYYAVRNAGWFLALKLVYNTAAAVGAGYLTALVGGYPEVKHGLALAVVQTLAFGWALTQPELSRWTPGWVWAALIVLSFAGILFGAKIRSRRRHSAHVSAAPTDAGAAR